MSSIQKNNTDSKMLEGTVVLLCALAAGAALTYQARELNHTRKEKEALQQYADVAQNFARRIQPDIPDVLRKFEYCDRPEDCMTCRAVKGGNEMAEIAYSNALKTLKINPNVLSALKNGPLLTP